MNGRHPELSEGSHTQRPDHSLSLVGEGFDCEILHFVQDDTALGG
jgi:hypothetical protein